MRYSVKKRSGLFSYITIFPKFIRHFSDFDDQPIINQFVQSSFKKIGQAIFHNFELLHKEVDPQDEKDQINASVMTIGNSKT